MTEKWKTVSAWPWYEVSDAGRVRSVDRVVRFSDGRVRPYKGRLLRATKGTHGYPAVKVCGPDSTSTICCVHHLVAQAFLGDRPAGYHIRHLDGNKDNIRLTNLAYGTVRQNRLDNKHYGQICGRQILTLDEAIAVKTALKRPYHGIGRALALKYGVSDSAISYIKRGISFSDVVV